MSFCRVFSRGLRVIIGMILDIINIFLILEGRVLCYLGLRRITNFIFLIFIAVF